MTQDHDWPEPSDTELLDVHWLRTSEVARRLKVDPRTVRRWLEARRMDYIQLPGGERRIPLSELERVLMVYPRETP